MKIEMTERDKKLLIFLAMFVIIVCIGYWGVYPIIKDISTIKTETEDQQDIKDMNEIKLSQVPIFEKDNEKLEEDILSARNQYYEMMSSDEIDNYITNLVLDYDLYAYDLSIYMPEEETDLEPYEYSAKKAELDAAEKAAANGETTESTDSTSSSIEAVDAAASDSATGTATEYTEDTGTGIYTATVSLRLGGDEKDLEKLIDDLSNSDKKLRVVDFEWTVSKSVEYADGNSIEDMAEDYELVETRILNLTLELYMCEE